MKKKITGKSAAHMAWLRSKRTFKKAPEAQLAPRGVRTRFSRESTGTPEKHSRDMIRLEVVRRHRAGEKTAQIASAIGLSPETVVTWTTSTTLPRKPTSPYTFARMLALVTLARQLYRQKFSVNCRHCLIEAVKRTPTMKWTSVDVYLSLEAVPVLAGFPLYADQAVQARCEALGRGERSRGTDIFDDPVMPRADAPAQSAPEPSQPASVPAGKTPAFDRERFLASRYRLQLPRLRL